MLEKFYDTQYLKGDITGGLVAGVVALPLALAFGVQSVLGATAGLYGAIAVGIFAALFGGTETQASGPTGPMTVVAATLVAAALEMSGSMDSAMGIIVLTFLLGGLFASMIRLELMTPQGDMVEAETYNKLFTMHGLMMVFFFLLPSVPAVLGNFLLPLMLGAKDLAFPKLNLLS